ncbi:MAG: DUF1311 domain-containing protein [Erythrobacter sp.]|nr:MAG: DUF1311 domain-containing protein [Erythrobacter sp.]
MILALLALATLQVDHDPRCDSTVYNELLGCAYDAWQTADQELNEQWRRMPHPERLIEAQRAWLVWRDLECTSQNGAIGGREELIWQYGCLAELTNDRTRQLQTQYRWL